MSKADDSCSELVDEFEAADITGLSVSNLRRDRMQRDVSKIQGPPFYRVSIRKVRYRRTDCLAWLESRRVSPQVRAS